MLSSRAKYAVRAVSCLATRPSGPGWTATSLIAAQEHIPRKFLEAILVELRRHRLLESRRGPGGGHRLLIPADRLSVADIIRIIDGPLALTPCASRTRPGPCTDCHALETCRLHPLLQQARDAMAKVLEACSFAELVAQTHFRTALSS